MDMSSLIDVGDYLEGVVREREASEGRIPECGAWERDRGTDLAYLIGSQERVVEVFLGVVGVPGCSDLCSGEAME